MSKQPLDDEMISRLHDWFEIPSKPELYRAVADWLASMKAEAWEEGRVFAARRAASIPSSVVNAPNPYRGYPE